MNRIQADTTVYPNKIEGDVEAIMKAEYATVSEWKTRGILEHLYLKEGASGAILVFKGMEQAEVEKLLTTLPLHPYMEQVTLTRLELSF